VQQEGFRADGALSQALGKKDFTERELEGVSFPNREACMSKDVSADYLKWAACTGWE
jgi:hypothetical protein